MSRINAQSQISNIRTENMYKIQCTALAENVYTFKNLLESGKADYIDIAYINKMLVYQGAIAWFRDEVMGLLALPFSSIGGRDVYGLPLKIEVFGENGYHKVLRRGEFVIMYDNMSKIPLIASINQYSTRLALLQRTIDINVSQQRTPRYWQVNNDNKKSVLDAIDGVNSYNDTIITYDGLDLGNISLTPAPAPYVTDKLSDEKDKLWNEFLRLIGVSNTTFEKKERNIKDEVILSQGGTIASRFNRFNPRKEAIDKINKMFDMNIEVGYYDGLPTTLKDDSEVSEDETNIPTTTNNSD